MKACSECGEHKPATAEYFYRCSASRDGLGGQCKTCKREREREYKRKYRESHGESMSEYSRKYYESHKESLSEYRRKYYEANRESRNEHQRKYRVANPEKARESVRVSNRKRGQDVGYRVSHSVSVGMWASLRQEKNGRSWESLVGYTLADLRAHLEKQFTNGMSWNNYGEWHIDHIKPVSHFTFDSPDDPEFLECWSLWNLQPMWASENMSKSNRCDAPPLPLLHGSEAR